jgi:RimJ/RimL family protein N-acetyltransferase
MDQVIRTERLLLRPLRAGDAEPVLALFNDWEVVRRLSMPPWPYALQDALDFILPRVGQQTPEEINFAITLDGDLIGGIGMRMKDASHLQTRAGPNLGYWLGRPHWGHGYMTEAARGIIGHAFAAGAGDTIYSGAFADNAASLRVQEKLGFVRAGETTLFARPRGAEFAHVNTLLTRAAFEASTS